MKNLKCKNVFSISVEKKWNEETQKAEATGNVILYSALEFDGEVRYEQEQLMPFNEFGEALANVDTGVTFKRGFLYYDGEGYFDHVQRCKVWPEVRCSVQEYIESGLCEDHWASQIMSDDAEVKEVKIQKAALAA